MIKKWLKITILEEFASLCHIKKMFCTSKLRILLVVDLLCGIEQYSFISNRFWSYQIEINEILFLKYTFTNILAILGKFGTFFN